MIGGKSIMANELALANGDLCTKEEYCAYHAHKKDNMVYELIDYYDDIPSWGAKAIEVYPSTGLSEILPKLGSPYGPAGSWSLMEKDREFISHAIKQKLTGMPQVNSWPQFNILNIGIAGLPHAIGIVKLIEKLLKNPYQTLHISFLDKCIKPLLDIQDYYKDYNGNVSVGVIHEDATKTLGDIPQCSVISAHYLFSFLGEDGVKKVMKNVYNCLSPRGTFVVATGEEDYMKPFPEWAKQFGFYTAESKYVWDVFDITSEDKAIFLTGESIISSKKNCLAQLGKMKHYQSEKK